MHSAVVIQSLMKRQNMTRKDAARETGSILGSSLFVYIIRESLMKKLSKGSARRQK